MQIKIREALDAPTLGNFPDLDVIVYGEDKLRSVVKELDCILQN